MTANNQENEEGTEATKVQSETENTSAENVTADDLTDTAATLYGGEATTDWEAKYNELNDSYLRLRAEFDNYRKRTLREKSDLIKSGGEGALIGLLPVIDDFERALDTMKKATDPKAVAEGVELIYSKFMDYLGRQGVKPIEAVGQPFGTEMFEAVAMIPAPDEAQKGRVIDCVQTGYVLNDKVIRHAKVVVGE
jgi:grpE